jgi:thiamine-phosphate pyrophosphorylase
MQNKPNLPKPQNNHNHSYGKVLSNYTALQPGPKQTQSNPISNLHAAAGFSIKIISLPVSKLSSYNHFMDRAIYRIIDANFNRAREAIRVVEEYCRFALNCSPLTSRAKQLRHELSAAIDRLNLPELITSRDTIEDVGVGAKVENQLKRTDLPDCFKAASKRLTEALRALAEMTQTFNPHEAETFENLRYTAYTLEKDIVIFADCAEKFNRVRLYIILTCDFPAELISLAQKCVTAGADCIQMRSKNIQRDDQLFALAVEFVKICRDNGVISIINDRPDIAVAADADGVHLGQNDLPIVQARKLQLKPLIIGKSTHSMDQLKTACEQYPTYVGLGPVFATPTKPGAPAVTLDYVTQGTNFLADKGIGHVAIGGINLDNVEEVLEAGAKTIAVVRAVTEAKDPAKACRALKNKIENFLKE